MAGNFWHKKSIESFQSELQNNDLKRSLGSINLVMLGIGAIIGTGIFVLTGTAAAKYAGPGLVLSFVISGLGCAFAGLCYAEFASMIPIAGSAYTYAYATMGRFIAWIIGWDLILEYLFGAATVAVGWSGYMWSMLRDWGLEIPLRFAESPGTKLILIPENIKGLHPGWIKFDAVKETLSKMSIDYSAWATDTAVANLIAAVAILLITVLLVVGIQESAKFNNVAVILKVVIVLLFIGFGASYVNSSNWQPFIPENTGNFGEFGWSGVLRASGVIFFAYIGFDAVSTAAQEAKNPQKDLPIGILGSLLVCTVLYILVTMVLTGIVSYKELNVKEPIAVAVDKAGEGLRWFAPMVKIGAVAGLSSVMLVMLMAQPRIFYTMAKDGLLPAKFAVIHPKYKTPYLTTILTGAICALVSAFLPIDVLGELVSIGTLLAFVIVCVGIIVLRRTNPEIHRPFKTPLVPLVPILGALICLAQMAGLPGDTWLRLIIWMAIGLIIYFAYGNSRLPDSESQK